jgi:acyl-CoA synthetase (AMP-forming)/AMP-acid ligase II
VDDIILVARQGERCGQEVVAVVAIHPGTDPTDSELLRCVSTRIAGYKLPKEIARVPIVERAPPANLTTPGLG